MGFMDKAKKLAEQAQEKLDEAQKNFNKSQSSDEPAGPAVQHDEHGRPIEQEEETPAAATEPPSATPPPPEDKPEGDADSSPDPFKPIQ
jgi:hypothetical protein